MIFSRILFPLLMFTDVDEELWKEDPESFIREKEDGFETLRDPAAASIQFLHATAKRKGILLPILAKVTEKLEPNDALDPHELDGALHVVGALAESISSDKRYKNDMEKLLSVHVEPRITHKVFYVRARALNVIREAACAPLRNRIFLGKLIDEVTNRLKDPNEELPVKFAAAMAIQALVTNQGSTIAPFVKPRLGDLIGETLKLLAKHQLEDLPTVVESLIENYQDDVIPVAEGIVLELVGNPFFSLASGERVQQSVPSRGRVRGRLYAHRHGPAGYDEDGALPGGGARGHSEPHRALRVGHGGRHPGVVRVGLLRGELRLDREPAHLPCLPADVGGVREAAGCV